jgi:hypothetical protein
MRVVTGHQCHRGLHQQVDRERPERDQRQGTPPPLPAGPGQLPDDPVEAPVSMRGSPGRSPPTPPIARRRPATASTTMPITFQPSVVYSKARPDGAGCFERCHPKLQQRQSPSEAPRRTDVPVVLIPRSHRRPDRRAAGSCSAWKRTSPSSETRAYFASDLTDVCPDSFINTGVDAPSSAACVSRECRS